MTEAGKRGKGFVHLIPGFHTLIVARAFLIYIFTYPDEAK